MISLRIPKRINGQDAILAMKNSGSPNWRQMEWIGFWFEFFVEQEIIPKLGGARGPVIGSTEFDLKMDFVWDLKAHPNQSDTLILNDQNAIRNCVNSHSGLGFIVVSGSVQYDDEESTFKQWHDRLKGAKSKYEIERIARGAPSRRRKISFSPESVHAIWLQDSSEIGSALTTGWLKPFQENMRNSDGSPRTAKFKMELNRVPTHNILVSKEL
jgi:hypothetical protein